MSSKKPFHSLKLDGGLQVDFIDLGNRYFGDYHRVKILVRCEVPLRREMFEDQSDPSKAFDRARRRLGESAAYEKTLERMGVAGAEVEEVRAGLVESFLASAGAYLKHPLFPRQLVASRLRERQSRPVAVPIR